jgi:hypothetical protein
MAAVLSIPGALEFNSQHPYLDNTDSFDRVHIPGAPAIGVAFDPASSTEKNCDVSESCDSLLYPHPKTVHAVCCIPSQTYKYQR